MTVEILTIADLKKYLNSLDPIVYDDDLIQFDIVNGKTTYSGNTNFGHTIKVETTPTGHIFSIEMLSISTEV